MPLYFIDVRDKATLTLDKDGLDFADDSTAQLFAQGAQRGTAQGALPAGDRRTVAMAIRNEAGTVIYQATMTLAGVWAEEETS